MSNEYDNVKHAFPRPAEAPATSNKSNSIAIAQSFVRRSAELKYKGKARDRAAAEFMLGAAMALDIAGIKDGGASMAAFLTLTRGYSAVEDIAKDNGEARASAGLEG